MDGAVGGLGELGDAHAALAGDAGDAPVLALALQQHLGGEVGDGAALRRLIADPVGVPAQRAVGVQHGEVALVAVVAGVEQACVVQRGPEVGGRGKQRGFAVDLGGGAVLVFGVVPAGGKTRRGLATVVCAHVLDVAHAPGAPGVDPMDVLVRGDQGGLGEQALFLPLPAGSAVVGAKHQGLLHARLRAALRAQRGAVEGAEQEHAGAVRRGGQAGGVGDGGGDAEAAVGVQAPQGAVVAGADVALGRLAGHALGAQPVGLGAGVLPGDEAGRVASQHPGVRAGARDAGAVRRDGGGGAVGAWPMVLDGGVE